MKTIPEMQNERSHLVRSQGDVLEAAEKENRNLTPEEMVEVDKLQAEADALENEISLAKEHAKRADRISKNLDGLKASGSRLRVPGFGVRILGSGAWNLEPGTRNPDRLQLLEAKLDSNVKNPETLDALVLVQITAFLPC